MGKKTPYDVAVGDAIKKARLQAGLTQSQVGKAISSHPHSIYQYENGYRSVTPNTAYALASTLNTSVKNFYPEATEIAAQINQIKKGKNG